MNLQRARELRDRTLSSSWSWYVLLLAYGVVIFVVLAPALFSSVGGDDSYWILEKAPQTGGSYWSAFWTPLSEVFDFSGQPRTTALAFSERGVLALFTIDVATYFSIPPVIVWAGVKIVLLLGSIGATVVFLRQLTFRDRGGEIRRISRPTIAFVATTLPLTIALGMKTQNVATVNGWNFYPTLAYGPFIAFLLVAALALRSSTLLQRSYRAWAVPVVVLMAFMGLVINLSYELMALTVPLVILVVGLQPRERDVSWWTRWRPALTVVAAFAVSYTAIFAWIRWQISQMACQATDTCYAGTTLEPEARALWHNFLGSLPGQNGGFVTEQAKAAGRAYPQANAISVGLAVLGAILMLALWAAWTSRRRAATETPAADADPDDPRNDVRGLLVVLAVSVSIALGSTFITGITARAVELLDTSVLSYRTNVVTWSALSLAIVATVRLLMITGRRVLGPLALGGLAVVLAVGVALYFPRNVMSAQENRAEPAVVFIDSLQREVTLGDTTRAGDTRRCQALTDFLGHREQVSPRISRSATGAQESFEMFHGRPYCSAGLPPVVKPRAD